MKFSALTLLLVASISFAQQVPNTFSAGQPAVADEVNENFADVDGRIGNNTVGINATITVVNQLFATIEFTRPTSRGVLVGEVFCPVDSLPISADCGCDFEDVTGHHIGLSTLVLCTTTTDGAVGMCVEHYSNPGLYAPEVVMAVKCMTATLVNGDKALIWKDASGKQSKVARPTGESNADVMARLQPLIEARNENQK